MLKRLTIVQPLLLLPVLSFGADKWPIKGDVVNGFGEPVQGATVRVYLWVGYEGDLDDLAKPFIEFQTDSKGRYEGVFTFAGSGGQRSFTITAEKEGYYLSKDYHISFGAEESMRDRTSGHVILRERIPAEELDALMLESDDGLSVSLERLLRRSRSGLIAAMLDHFSEASDRPRMSVLRSKMSPVFKRIASTSGSDLQQPAQDLVWFLEEEAAMNRYGHYYDRYLVDGDFGAPTVEKMLDNMAAEYNHRIAYTIDACVKSPFSEKLFLSVIAVSPSGQSRFNGSRGERPLPPAGLRTLLVAVRKDGTWRVFWRESISPTYPKQKSVAPWEAVFPRLLEYMGTGNPVPEANATL